MLAERLGWPQLTSERNLTINGTTVTAVRVNGTGHSEISASLPAVVSVTEKVNEPRYPSFKGIMAAKKKPLTTVGRGELGLDPSTMGLANASTKVRQATVRPAKQAGIKITDEGNAATQVFEQLTAASLI
jgi:electron transfer flavoprotein beta subunit